MTIRTANLGDAERIGQLHVRAWQWAYRGLMPDEYLEGMDAQARSARWRSMLSDTAVAPAVVAEVDGELAGFCSFGPSRDVDAPPGTGEVMALYLEQTHVGHGVGFALWQEACGRLAQSGLERVTVWVLDTNELGRRFYERRGLAADGAQKFDDLRGFPVREVRFATP